MRRGVSSALIHSMKFSINSNFLNVTSDSGTLHIFDLTESSPEKEDKSPDLNGEFLNDCSKEIYIQNEENEGPDGKKSSYFSGLISSLIPSSDIIRYPKSTYSHHEESLKGKCLSALDCSERKVLAFTYEGDFKFYDINFETKEIAEAFNSNFTGIIKSEN